MRRRPDGFRPVIDFLIASAFLTFQAEGASMVSLSGAPLARVRNGAVRPTQRVLDRLGAVMEPAYGFRSLHAYKSKFQPRREPLHLVYRRAADLPLIGFALLRAYLAKAPARRTPARTPVAVPAQNVARESVTVESRSQIPTMRDQAYIECNVAHQ